MIYQPKQMVALPCQGMIKEENRVLLHFPTGSHLGELWVINSQYTRHTHSVNASCSYEVHEDIICIHTNGSLEDVAVL